jgi:HSP20 family protein
MADAARKSPIDNPKPTKLRPQQAEPESGAPQGTQAEGAEGEGSSWDHPMESLRREWDRAVGSFPARWPFGRPNLDNEPFWRKPFSAYGEPAADIAERDDKYEIFIELPGIEEKDIQLKIANGVLVVRGEKRGEREEVRKDYYLSERTFGTIQRSLRVPDGVDLDQVEATFDNGVLTVTLPKTHEARQPEKRIPIKPGRKL